MSRSARRTFLKTGVLSAASLGALGTVSPKPALHVVLWTVYALSSWWELSRLDLEAPEDCSRYFQNTTFHGLWIGGMSLALG